MIVHSCSCLMNTQLALPYLIWKSSFGISTHIHYHQIYGKLQAYSIFDMSILNLHFILNNLESFFSLHNGDVLKTNMMTHSTFSFFKTFFTGDSGVYTPDTPATLGSTLTRPFFGSSLNITCLDQPCIFFALFFFSP